VTLRHSLRTNEGQASRTDTTAGASAAALAATLGIAAVCWFVAIREMSGTDMGVSSRLGSFAFFLALWAAMMAAMMLPGAVPAVLSLAQASGRVLSVQLFVASYLAVWTLVGLAVYALYRPHGTIAAGVCAVVARSYELTPLKGHVRRLCRERVRSGLHFGLSCVGSSSGLMLVLLALGLMSITWMSVIAVVIAAQKLLPPRAALDVPVALAIVALGVLILTAPSLVPGLTTPT
jgi:predicted metal-binding membrane protein